MAQKKTQFVNNGQNEAAGPTTKYQITSLSLYTCFLWCVRGCDMVMLMAVPLWFRPAVALHTKL